MTCPPNEGSRDGALTSGEAATLAGMIAGLAPEPADAWLLLTVTICENCGQRHSFRLDKNVSLEAAERMLMHAMDLMIRRRIARGDYE